MRYGATAGEPHASCIDRVGHRGGRAGGRYALERRPARAPLLHDGRRIPVERRAGLQLQYLAAVRRLRQRTVALLQRESVLEVASARGPEVAKQEHAAAGLLNIRPLLGGPWQTTA